MTGLKALQSVQYVMVEQKKFAILDINSWKLFLDWLDTLVDIGSIKSTYKQIADSHTNHTIALWSEKSSSADKRIAAREELERLRQTAVVGDVISPVNEEWNAVSGL
ncbi:MAG: hypothetical protein AAF639_22225 [Chloroflexota bacterium]